MRKLRYPCGIITVFAILLSGCNLPSGEERAASLQTEAALTVQADLTAAAPSATPTSTTAPFPTLPVVTATVPTAASPTSTCDVALFVSDVSIPDDTVMTQNQTFTKTWRLKNVGTCSWTTSYALIFSGGESMGGPATQPLDDNIKPGETVDLSVDLKAPASDGTYRGNWGLRNAGGFVFSSFWVQIKVGAGAGAFTVTGVTYDLSTFDEGGSYVGCPMVTAHIQTNGAGDVQYHWVRSDGTESVQSLTFTSAGTKNVSEKWYLGSGASGTQWLGIYIDSPNAQDFGHIDVNKCTTP